MANSLTLSPCEISEDIAARLNLYALCATAAGVSLTALAQPSEAKIVYTPAHHQLSINKPFNLDLNHDGITDFSLSASHFVPKSSTLSGTEVRGFAVVLPPKKGNSVVGYPGDYFSFYASALKAGVRVGRKSPFIAGGNSGIIMGGELLSSHQGTLNLGPWSQTGKGVKNRFLGFKFRIRGKVHYGWARLNVRIVNYFPDVKLTGYAYETIPNRGIDTGRTKGRDSRIMGRLALGAGQSTQ